MKRLTPTLGDFVAQKHPKESFYLKKGIVVASKEHSFIIQWLSYNKDFFMEFEGPAFEELNSRYLLTKMSYNRNYRVDIAILSKAG
tara:strand:+ start:6810 stop:7067 length:258 start_codon:yes stop_codon:yes gene_type:complete